MGYVVTVYNKNDLCAKIFVGNRGEPVICENYTKIVHHTPFGGRDEATYKDLMDFYADRCFPAERENCKEVLRTLGLDYYDPELICRKTHGYQFDDFMWFNFSDEEPVTFDDIKLRG